MRSLTVTEAQTRATSIAVSSYDVELDLTRGDTHFWSRTVVEFASRDRQATFIDIQPSELLHARLNERELDVSQLHEGRFHLDGLSADNVLTVEATMAYSRDGEGLHRAVDPEDGLAYVYAMAFLAAAPRIFACFDQPDLKATVRLRVKAPDDWTVLGNGRATMSAAGRWELAPTKPISTYLTTVVAGPYHSVTREHDGIRLGLHCRQSLAEHLDKDAEELFDVTANCLDEYHRLFGIRYPFGDYHQAFCPEFNAGAMENPGCVTFTDAFVFKARATDTLRTQRAMVIAHEMAHQWFGDLVTMTWWDDLWLNESFADYMGYRVAHDAAGFHDIWVEWAYNRKPWGLAADQRSSTHPVAGNGAQTATQALNDFDGISYAKGSALLAQLRAYLGDEAWIGGVTDHLRRHSYANAGLADLLESWDAASDKDVHAWADAWLRTSGVDTLSVEVADGRPAIRRINGSSPSVSRPHALVAAWFRAQDPPERRHVLVDSELTSLDLTSYDGTGILLPDCQDDSWSKIVLDNSSRQRAAEFLQQLHEPLPRAVIWSSLREGLFDATLSPDDYLDVVEQALPGENDIGLEAVLSLAVGQVGAYFPRADQRLRLAGVARTALHGAHPSSNRQLIAARLLIKTSSDLDELSRWVDGAPPEGLEVDDDLRWRVLRAMCSAGHAGVDDIRAQKRLDTSSQGAVHALECSAAIPDASVKADVWDRILSDTSLSNFELYALADFFFRPGQSELTSPYVARYFDDVASATSKRSEFLAEQLAYLAYPRFAVERETVERAVTCMAQQELPAGPRRAISDQTDDLRRVVTSREIFGV
ncbi:MAG: aminopeptidase N [Nocardioidaceae bacterium]